MGLLPFADKQAPLVYETWKYLLKQALQGKNTLRNSELSGILLTISNSSEFTLRLQSSETTHGVWSLAPPEVILPGAQVDFGAESHGITGTAGKRPSSAYL